MEEKRLPFEYFIHHKSQVIAKIEAELALLHGMRYCCADCDLHSINQQIANLRRAIKYNRLLS